VAPDAPGTLITLIVAAVVLAVVTAFGWDHVRGVWAWLTRPLALVLCLSTAVLAAVVATNREVEIYTSWAEMFGTSSTPSDSGTDSDVVVASTTRSGSRLVSFVVNGRASHLTLPVYVYLPPGYDGPALRGRLLPVIEAFDGYPGSPMSWLKTMHAQQVLDAEILAQRMAPTVVVFPYQTPSPIHDTECVNAVNGLAVDTFLTADVPAAVEHLFRVRPDGASWGTIGYSTGGFCSVNLALRHPDRYGAAASLSGYFSALTDRTTGDLYAGNVMAKNQNTPLWRLRQLPVPRLSVYLAAALDDKSAVSWLTNFIRASKPPLRVTTATVPIGGHSKKAWLRMEPAALDWLSSWLGGPVEAPATSVPTGHNAPRLTTVRITPRP
jgi:pimeloyl-ACP methyl ester carboxylesterase